MEEKDPRITKLKQLHQDTRKHPDYPETCFPTSVIGSQEIGINRVIQGKFRTDDQDPKKRYVAHTWTQDPDSANIFELNGTQFNDRLTNNHFEEGVNVITPVHPNYTRYQPEAELEVTGSLFIKALKFFHFIS